MTPDRPEPRRAWLRVLASGVFGSVLFTGIAASISASVVAGGIAAWFFLWLLLAAGRFYSWRSKKSVESPTSQDVLRPIERLLLDWYDFIVFVPAAAAIIVWVSVRAHRFPFF